MSTPRPEPRWSILIPTVPSRLRLQLPTLVTDLRLQIGERPIEVLWFGDNKWRGVGAKRNALLQLAQGAYVSFIDDDDHVAPDYIDRIWEAIRDAREDADVVCYDHLCIIDGGPPILCKYSIHYEYAHTPKLWTGKPAHTQTWRRALIQDVRFPDLNIGEDMDWVAEASARVASEVQLPGPPLYIYNCRTDVSETRGDGLLRDVPPLLQAWWVEARRSG